MDEDNVGVIDRIVRVLLGITLLVFAELTRLGIFVQALLIVLGATIMVTGFAGFCLIYKMCGIKTTRRGD